ncbi:hypothetical protein ANTRET_LOCUS1414 [Anthophora retusa]
MVKKFRKYIERKELRVNRDKTMVMVLEKRRRKNEKAEGHTKDRVRGTMIAMKRTWSIGERLFKESFERRMKMLEALVESVQQYAAEIWGWTEKNRLDTETKAEEIRIRALRIVMKYEGVVRKSNMGLVKESIREMDKNRVEEGQEASMRNKKRGSKKKNQGECRCNNKNKR